MEFSADKSSINKGESITFIVNITAVVNSSINYTLNFGDGIISNLSNNVKNMYNLITYQYDSVGSYNAQLKVFVDGVSYERTKNIVVSDIIPPTITLLEPQDDAVINTNSINLSYKARDDSNLSNCTLTIYYFNDSNFGFPVYNNSNSTLKNDEIVKLDLRDFDEGKHSWDVGCYDKFGNYKEDDRDFEVDIVSVLLDHRYHNANLVFLENVLIS